MLYLSTGYDACFGEQKLVCDASGSVISSVISRITGRCDNTVTILRDSINNPFWWSKTIYLVASTCAIAESTSDRSGWTRAQTRLPDWAGPMANPYNYTPASTPTRQVTTMALIGPMLDPDATPTSFLIIKTSCWSRRNVVQVLSQRPVTILMR